MRELTRERLEPYLAAVLGGPVRVLGFGPLGQSLHADVLKGYGYGVPILVEFESGGRTRRAVLETMSPGPFGHEHMADRAQVMLWDHHAFNALPRHVRSHDVGAFRSGGEIVSLGDAEELFVLMEFVDGRGYFEDLARLRDLGEAPPLDVARADALCDWLVEVHARRGGDPGLYARRLRELVGHGECIMGLTDSYPPRHGFLSSTLLEAIEHRCLAWRWRLKGRSHRLCRVHGDFHPWNLLFREGTDFTVLDRSRGEWGDAADDLTCLTMNYLFFSLQRRGRVEGALAWLFQRFWRRYVEATGDREVLEVAAPFFAFRGLVMASPLWYPNLDEEVRLALLRFVVRVLDAPSFDLDSAVDWCESTRATGLRDLDYGSPRLRQIDAHGAGPRRAHLGCRRRTRPPSAPTSSCTAIASRPGRPRGGWSR